MNKKEKEEQKTMYESYFLNEGVINFIKTYKKDDLEESLKEAKKYCNIPVKDAGDLLNQLQDNDFLSVERASPWEFSSISVLNYTGEVRNFGNCRAGFNLVNKWEYKQPYKYFQIIYSDDYYVKWFGNILIDGPVFWVSTENAVHRITYTHRVLKIYPNVCTEQELIAGLDNESLDKVVKKYYKLLRFFDPTFKMLEHEDGNITFDLEEYFPKGFFYKGPKYNYKKYRKVNYYAFMTPGDHEKRPISQMNDVKTENGLLKIEIENQTYPHSGYVYLDLAKMELVKPQL